MSEEPRIVDLAELERRLRQWHEERRQFVRECTDCQTTCPVDWQFCAHCGARLAVTCPSCGEPLPPVGARFCAHCGVEIPSDV